MTEEDMGFDVRPIPEIVREQKDVIKEKKDMRKYWEKQHINRGALSVLKPLIEKVNKIKSVRGFKNDSQALEYLLDLEEDIKKHNLIKETKSCEKCGTPINVKLDSYKGITHRHIDTKSNCFGYITTKYGIVDNDEDILDDGLDNEGKPFVKWTKEEMEEKLKSEDLRW